MLERWLNISDHYNWMRAAFAMCSKFLEVMSLLYSVTSGLFHRGSMNVNYVRPSWKSSIVKTIAHALTRWSMISPAGSIP